MALDVICDVDSCAYNKGTECCAKAIKVCNNNCNEAEKVKETQCNTFKCK